MNQTHYFIMAFSFGLLFFASLVTFLLRKKNPDNPTFLKVSTIVKTWWWIVAFLNVCLITAPTGLLIGFATLSLLAAKEFYAHSRLIEIKKYLFGINSAYILFQYVLLAFGQFQAFQTLPFLAVLILLPPLMILNAQANRLPEVVASFVAPILWFHCLACLPALYLVGVKFWGAVGETLNLIFILLLLTEGNDVCQFICGKIWGQKKILPFVSPNKTEAGFIGGILVTTILGSFLFSLNLNFTYEAAAALSFLIAVYGIFGDLSFSTLKRHFGTKDFSEALPGHGGYLDRLDSLIFTSPVLFYGLWFMKGMN